MIELFLFLIVVYSIATIITHEYIFERVRSYIIKKEAPEAIQYLIQCNKCMSTWIGFGLGFIFFSGIIQILTIPFVCYFFAKAMNKILE